MLLALQQLIWTIWKWVDKHLRRACNSCASLGLRSSHSHLSSINPLTELQRNGRVEAFINDIDLGAVQALASRHNKGLPCTLSGVKRGSFNAVFFARFHTTGETLVVRIPIAPVVHNAWLKLRSEAYTMKYIGENTSIPIPRVYTCSHARLLRGDPRPQAFMITEYIAGRPLGEQIRLTNYSEEQRRTLFSDLIDIFTSLRGLEFSASGSLMPSRWWSTSSKPRIVSSISIPKNNLLVDGYAPQARTPTSFSEYLDYQRHLIREAFSPPMQDLDRELASMELFAIYHFGAHIQSMAEESSQNTRFVLAHTDLRRSNIMVDDNLHITGVIDWEWSHTIPSRFLMPPPWITKVERLFREFCSVLATKQATSPDSQLLRDWDQLSDKSLDLHVADVFLRPLELVTTFNAIVYRRLFSEPLEEATRKFFLNDKRELELQERLENSRRYTKYLKDEDLYVVQEEDDEEPEEVRRLLEEAKKKFLTKNKG